MWCVAQDESALPRGIVKLGICFGRRGIYKQKTRAMRKFNTITENINNTMAMGENHQYANWALFHLHKV